MSQGESSRHLTYNSINSYGQWKVMDRTLVHPEPLKNDNADDDDAMICLC